MSKRTQTIEHDKNPTPRRASEPIQSRRNNVCARPNWTARHYDWDDRQTRSCRPVLINRPWLWATARACSLRCCRRIATAVVRELRLLEQRTFSAKTLPPIGQRGPLSPAHLVPYMDMPGWKVSIVLLSANALWDMFDAKKMCLYVSSDTWVHDYVQFRAKFPIGSPNATCLYKIVSTVRREDVQVFIKKDASLH